MNLDRQGDPQHDFQSSLGIARKILQVATALRLPLNPKVYRVLYEAEARPDGSLRRLRDDISERRSEPDVVEIEKLHDEVFELHDEHAGVAQIGERMLAEIGEVGTMMASTIGEGSSFIGSLQRTRSSIGLLSRASDVKRAIDQLVAESEQHAARNASVVSQLEEKQERITELERELRALRDRVNIDHLTGLYNRRFFDEILAAKIAEAHQSHRPISVVLADLDHFKRVNDTWGHAVGDSVLRQFAGTLRSHVKGRDIVARHGGEEFALILPDTELPGARTVADTIRQVFHSRNFVASDTQDRIGHLSASFGVAMLRSDDTPESVIARADTQLYEAKRRGRNTVCVESLPAVAPLRSAG